MNRTTLMTIAVTVSALALGGCEKPQENAGAQPAPAGGATAAQPDHHAGESTTHGHEETPLGTAQVGDLLVECAQGHGHVAAGKEMHLVVKLPYNDQGASVVRAWIGTEDRMQSRVARGEYAASHDDYDIHAEAPNPLPEGAVWWIEVEQPDGAKHVGSCRIL